MRKIQNKSFLLWKNRLSLWKAGFSISIFAVSLVLLLSNAREAGAVSYQFVPTGQNLVTGTDQNVTSATAASGEGVNMGSWKGTLANDSFHWAVASTASGIDMQLNVGGVALNGANKLIIQTEIDIDATAPNMLVQICDWSSTTSVDAAADARCTGGGWRTLNTQNASNADIAYNDTTANGDELQWHIYDGYFTTGTTGGSAVSTPLSNFVNGSGVIKIRYYSTTNTVSVVSVDYLRISAIIDSIYHPAGVTNQNVAGGVLGGTYANAIVVGNSATGQISTTAGDAIYLTGAGTAGASVADYYVSFQNVKTLTGMNSIVVRADYSCSAATGNFIPQIRNFSTSSWENLSAATIACSATDAVNGWAKSNITLSDYVSSGEIRVRISGSANGTHTLRLDSIYVMVGSVNSDSSLCQITLGTGTATDCTNTRTLDMNSATSAFANAAEDESTTMGTGEANSSYAGDTDQDINQEEGTSANISVPVTLSTNTQVVGQNYATRFSGCGASGAACGATALTVQAGIRDFSGANQATGGWLAVGTTNGSATYTYQDSITRMTNSLYGNWANPDDYIDTVNNLMNIRLRTSGAGTLAQNVTTNWDFAFLTLQWIESSTSPTKRHVFTPTSQNIVTGTDDQQVNIQAVAAIEGINMGSWRGTLADDNWQWIVSSTTSGIDMQLNVDGVQLYSGNKMVIQTEIDLDATVPNLKVQICDWVSTTSVDNAADAQCTGGGWRTLNTQNASDADVNYTDTAGDALQWHIYDGYFATGATGGTSISTPLSNFISADANKRVKIRYYSTTNTTSTVVVDYLRVSAFIDSLYSPASVTQITGGAMVGTYTNAIAVGNSATAQVLGTDDIRLSVPGTAGAISDFYFTFKNVQTYTGMNTIYVKAEYSCSNTGINLRPKIYNFNSSAWENLGSAAIACSTTDATNGFAVNNVTVTNYINGSNEVRVGWYGSGNNILSLRIDHIFIILGTTNSDTSQCEITLGTGTATNCLNTRDVVGPAAMTSFSNPAESESTNMGTGEANSIYSLDSDNDATVEKATSSNIKFSVTEPTDAHITGIHFAGKFAAGADGTNPDMTVQLGFKDYSGFNQTTGGWTAAGATSTNATQAYTDSVTALTASAYGLSANADDYIDTYNNTINLRLRTTAGGLDSRASTTEWDFAFVSLQWINTTVQTMSIQGSCRLVDRSTNCSGTPTVKYAVNGSVQSDTTTVSTGSFSLTVPVINTGAVVTVYLDEVDDANEAVAVTKYDGTGNMTGVLLYEKHLTIGSSDNQSITNANLSTGFVNDEDVFYSVSSNNLTLDASTNNSGQSLYIVSGNTYAPGGTATVAGSWVNAGTFTHDSSTVTLNGTATGYTIDANNGNGPFYNLTVNGSGGGWTVTNTDVTIANNLTVTTGTLNGGSRTITIAGAGGEAWCNDSTGITCNSSWGSRKKITFNNSASSENLVDFPVLIQLSGSNIDYSKTQNSGQDLRFVDPADPTVVLDHEIELWNESGTSFVWVKVPQINSASSADYIWMYYNNNAASDGQNTTGTWNSAYVGVWHMAESPNGTSNEIKDDTSNANHGTSQGSMNSADQVDAKAGKGLDFDGTDDDIRILDSANLQVQSHTISAWIKRDTTPGGTGTVVSKNRTSSADSYKITTGGDFTYCLEPAAGALCDSAGTFVNSTWYHFVATWNGSTMQQYLNGSANGAGSAQANAATYSTNEVYIGAEDNTGNDFMQNFFDGIIDEVRISNVRRSAEWIEAEYLFSVDNTKYTYGSEENSASPFTVAGTWTPASSTVKFTASTTTSIPAYTYHNLQVLPGGNGITHTLGAGTFTIGGTLTIGNGVNTGVTVTAATNSTTITITGSISIAASTTFIANASNALTIGDDWTNAGTFTHSSGTVVFDTTTQSDIDGNSDVFFNFTASTATKTVKFKQGETVRFNGLLTLTDVTIDSIDGATQWTINHQGTESITGVTITRAACDAGSTTITVTSGSSGGSNGVCWSFPGGITISGFAYDDESTGDLAICDGSTQNISVKVGSQNLYNTTCANSGNAFSFSSVTQPSAGDVVTIFFNTNGGSVGNTVIRYSGTGDITSIYVRKNRLIVSSTDSTAVTNTLLNNFDNTGGTSGQDTDIVFDVSGGNLVVEDGIKLIVDTNKTFTPGGNITTSPSSDGTDSVVDGDVLISSGATLSMETNSLSIGGDLVTTGTFTYSSGQSTTFTATATGHTIDESDDNFHTLVFNGSGGGWSFVSPVTIVGNMTVTAGTLSGTQDLTVNGGTVTGDGTINLTGGIFLLDTTGNFGGAGNWTFNNLTFGDGTGSTTTTSTGAGSITVTSVLTISANQTLDAKGKTWTLSGTSGAPLVVNGTFNDSQDTSTFAFTGNNTGGNTVIPSLGYHNLTVNQTLEIFTLSSNLTLTGNLSVTAGIMNFNINDVDVDINGSVINAGTLIASDSAAFTVARDFDNNSGTFTHSSGTVTFDSLQTSQISGPIMFYNFTSLIGGKNIEFEQTTLFNVFGIFNVQGIPGNPIHLRSQSIGQQWQVNFDVAQSNMRWVTIRDSGCNGGQDMQAHETIFDQGNNGVCWRIILRGGGGGSADGSGAGGGGGVGGGGAGGGGNVQATGTATISGGAVTGVVVVNPGNGYVAVPVVCFIGVGNGAAANAITSNGSVETVNITNGGSGYNSAPTVAFLGGFTIDGGGPGCGGGQSGGGAGGGGGGGETP